MLPTVFCLPLGRSLLWSMGLQSYVAADVEAYVALALTVSMGVLRPCRPHRPLAELIGAV
jgi:hypothetical protein